MKKYFLIPAVAAAAYVGVRHLPAPGRQIYLLLLEGLACVGPILAARTFEAGDYLRRAWLCFGLANAFLFASAASRFIPGTSPALAWARIGAIFMSNLLTIIGSVLFARTAGKAGLALPGTALSRGGGYVLSVGVALAFGIPSVAPAFAHFSFAHLPSGLTPFFATAGDAVSLALIAPILMTALALRGGLIAWPWIFLTCAELAWLVFDLAIAVLPDEFDVPATCFRMAAYGFTLAAGLARRRISTL
jgi:hypothetical protein